MTQQEPSLVGSVLRGHDSYTSDLDILLGPTPETTLFDVSAIRLELGKLRGVPVDRVKPNALPEKYRASVLAEVARRYDERPAGV